MHRIRFYAMKISAFKTIVLFLLASAGEEESLWFVVIHKSQLQ